MNKIHFVFFAFLLVFVACQGEPASKVKTAAKKTAKSITTSGSKASDSQANTSDTSTQEAENTDGEKPELLEFYVKEDKKKSERKKKSETSSKAASSDTASSEKKSTPKKKSTSRKKSAKMKFVDDTFAFGVIKPGDVIEHKFEFTNTGTKDLVITNAEATCGCTQPSFPFIPIPPGEKGYIGVKYDSTGKLGTQKPTVTLTTNAYPKTQKVYLEGLVIGKMAN